MRHTACAGYDLSELILCNALHQESDRIMFRRVLFCLLVVALGVAMAAPAWASASAPAGEGDINPVGPSAWKLDLALWTAVVFVCLAAVLWKFAWGPLAAALDKRERTIADQIAEAEAANQKAKDVLADYEQKLADAKNDVRGIVDQGRRDAEKLGRELLDKAKEEAAAEHVRAMQQIEAAADAAVKSLADQSAAMAVDLAGKIVRAKLNPADHARLIEQAVGGFVRGGSDVSRN
jgi:F-type H+-transporting ATPase subunit b